MSDKLKGSAFALLSSVIFGLSPIYVKISSEYGLNVVTFTLIRAVIAALIYPLVCRAMRITVIPERKSLRDVLLVCGLGSGLTGFFLPLSYNYLSSGIATSIHFTYPVIVVIAQALFFREKLRVGKIVALILSTVAIVLFTGGAGDVSSLGIILALASAVAYTWYMIGLSSTKAKDMHPFTLLFYCNIFVAAASLLYGLVSDTLVFSAIELPAILILAISLPVYSFFAHPLFQLGVKYAGPTTAAILSTMEPLVSIVAGMFVLGELMDVTRTIGCLAIVISAVIVVTTARAATTADKERRAVQ